jgi:hypothetical protein
MMTAAKRPARKLVGWELNRGAFSRQLVALKQAAHSSSAIVRATSPGVVSVPEKYGTQATNVRDDLTRIGRRVRLVRDI